MAFDSSKEYGIVLEGGGAKGAYQIGVWKAMLECNVKIKGLAGVSVGALNGALICMQDYEMAEDLWRNITYSKIMNVNNEQMHRLMSGNLKELDLVELTRTSAKILLDGGFDVKPLKALIEKYVKEDVIKNAPIEFVLGTFSISQLKELNITAKEAEPGFLKDYLLASAYFPAFKNEKLHGKKFIDGGIINNVPIDMLLKKGYKNIIVVRIFGIGLEKPIKIPKDVNIIEIAPRVNLGNILDFDSKKTDRNIRIGYYDGLRAFKGLSGKVYYIDSNRDEEYYLNCLTSFNNYVKMAFIEWAKEDYINSSLYNRILLEKVYPIMANELKLEKNWTYKTLYIAFLELCAKYLRIQKYKVYTEDEFVAQICKKYIAYNEKNVKFPIFVDLILKSIIIEEDE